MHLCVSLNEWLVFGTYMKLQSILVIFLVRLLLYCGDFLMGAYNILVRFGLEIHSRKGLDQMGFYLFWWDLTFVLYF